MKLSLGKIIIIVLFLFVLLIAYHIGPPSKIRDKVGSVRYAIGTANPEMLRKAIAKEVTPINELRVDHKDILTATINWKRMSGRDAFRNMTPEDVEEWKQKTFELVSVLMEFGVDVNSDNGRPLDDAINLRMNKVAKLLLKNGADPNYVFGHVASSSGPDMLAMLLEYGANTDITSSLTFLVRENNGTKIRHEKILLLLKHGANVNKKDFYGMSAFPELVCFFCYPFSALLFLSAVSARCMRSLLFLLLRRVLLLCLIHRSIRMVFPSCRVLLSCCHRIIFLFLSACRPGPFPSYSRPLMLSGRYNCARERPHKNALRFYRTTSKRPRCRTYR